MRRAIGALLFAAGAVCVFAGFELGQARGVFIKAIMVCLECIGLG